MFETARFKRISQNIVKQIRQAILRGDLKPGDHLPPEKELSEKFGVSKASLREAFRALEALGLLEVRQGVSGGAFVREVDLETAREGLFNYLFFKSPSIEEFTQLRRIIEPPVAEIAAGKISEKELSDLEANLAKTKSELETGSYMYEIDIEFHRILASTTGNSLIYLIVDSMQSALVSIKQRLHPDYDFTLKVYQAHSKILQALREGKGAKAKEEMRKHIDEVEESLVALSRLRKTGAGENPVPRPKENIKAGGLM